MKYQDRGSGDWQLSKLGFNLGLFWLVALLTNTGIVTSIIVLLLACLPVKFELLCEPKYWSKCIEYGTKIYYHCGGFGVAISLFWLFVCFMLRRRNNQRTIRGIEKITQNVNYINGSLELLVYLVCIGYIVKWYMREKDFQFLMLMIPIVFLMVLISIRLQGIRTQNKFLLCIYVISRYIIIVFAVPGIIGVLAISTMKLKSYLVLLFLILFIIGVIYVFLDIGLTVIYYNILRRNNEDIAIKKVVEVMKEEQL